MSIRHLSQLIVDKHGSLMVAVGEFNQWAVRFFLSKMSHLGMLWPDQDWATERTRVP
ncbi:MAG: hypothetical protein ACK475_11345 [Bacteroidota bacterium]|jgi:hypothetical protein